MGNFVGCEEETCDAKSQVNSPRTHKTKRYDMKKQPESFYNFIEGELEGNLNSGNQEKILNLKLALKDTFNGFLTLNVTSMQFGNIHLTSIK